MPRLTITCLPLFFVLVSCASSGPVEGVEPRSLQLEYLVVDFPETREVLVDGEPSGKTTGEMIELRRDVYHISLAGPSDFSPAEHRVRLKRSTPLSPVSLRFQKAADE